MTKALYLIPRSLEKYDGIAKKIISQYQALKNNKLDIKLCFLKRKENYNISREILNEEIILKNFKSTNKYTRKLFSIYLLWNFNDVFDYILRNNIKIIYIRYEYSSNYGFIKFLKKLKEKKITILIEIPTYPYDEELLNGSFVLKTKYRIDKYYRRYLKNYVDKIITFSNDNEIYGIKTIKINNGIDINKISLINKKEKNEAINFIGVAGISLWHGFDRFILSMVEYYKSKPKEIINFHIVGDGDKRLVNELKKIVKDNNLEKYIIFYGYKSGKELDKIYNKANIAIGCLGNHRKKISYIQPLKNREYAAKGLPMVFSERDPGFENVNFVYKASEDENLLNIKEIIKWYNNLKMSSEEIREFSKKFDWNIQMKKILNEL